MLRKQTNAANELCLLSVANYARNITVGETDANIKYIGSVDRNTAQYTYICVVINCIVSI